MDIAIIGANPLGCSLALKYASEGHEVILLEKEKRILSNLSGILAPYSAKCYQPGILSEYMFSSLEAWPEMLSWIEDFAGESKNIIDNPGLTYLYPALLGDIFLHWAEAQNRSAYLLSYDELKEINPSLREDTTGKMSAYQYVHFPWVERLDIENLSTLFAKALQKQNVRVELGSKVTSVDNQLWVSWHNQEQEEYETIEVSKVISTALLPGFDSIPQPMICTYKYDSLDIECQHIIRTPSGTISPREGEIDFYSPWSEREFTEDGLEQLHLDLDTKALKYIPDLKESIRYIKYANPTTSEDLPILSKSGPVIYALSSARASLLQLPVLLDTVYAYSESQDYYWLKKIY